MTVATQEVVVQKAKRNKLSTLWTMLESGTEYSIEQLAVGSGASIPTIKTQVWNYINKQGKVINKRKDSAKVIFYQLIK